MKWSRSVIIRSAGAIAVVWVKAVRADVLYTSGQADTSHTNFSYGSSDGHTGYGDDYSTNYTTVNLTGFSFYGGTTIPGEYVVIDFYSTAGVKAATIYTLPVFFLRAKCVGGARLTEI